jgi:hypothetical protein
MDFEGGLKKGGGEEKWSVVGEGGILGYEWDVGRLGILRKRASDVQKMWHRLCGQFFQD